MYPIVETLEDGELMKARYNWMVFQRLFDRSHISHPLARHYFSNLNTEKLRKHPVMVQALHNLHKNKTIREIKVRGPYPNRKEYFKWLTA